MKKPLIIATDKNIQNDSIDKIIEQITDDIFIELTRNLSYPPFFADYITDICVERNEYLSEAEIDKIYTKMLSPIESAFCEYFKMDESELYEIDEFIDDFFRYSCWYKKIFSKEQVIDVLQMIDKKFGKEQYQNYIDCIIEVLESMRATKEQKGA